MRTAFLCALGALASTACAPEATLPEETFAPIRIGVVTSLSGGLGTDGPGWLRAARVAQFEINSAGGPLPGRQIELVVENDETDPERAQAIGQRLTDEVEGVVGIVGAAASSISLGILDFSEAARIPQLSCCSTSDLITERNAALALEDRFFFRTIAPDILQSAVVAIAAEDLSCERLAILHLDDDYGEPFGVGIEESFTARGGTVVARIPFADAMPSYATEVGMIRDATPDCIALVAYPGSAGQIIRDWNSVAPGTPVTWIGTDGVRAPGFVDEVGDPRLIEGFYGTSPITDALTPSYNAFVERYRAIFGEDPIPFSSNQYDALALLALAIARAGTTDGDAVRDALREVSAPPADRGVIRAGELGAGLQQLREGRDIDYEGASGNVDFDERGDVVSPFEIWRYDSPAVGPCPQGATLLGGDRGSFCRFRTINAEDIGP
jgi:ABC-type branched-subunit amino acid transport system substrate-binding protein